MPRRPIPEGHQALGPRIDDCDRRIDECEGTIDGATWETVTTRHATWGDVEAAHSTWADVGQESD